MDWPPPSGPAGVAATWAPQAEQVHLPLPLARGALLTTAAGLLLGRLLAEPLLTLGLSPALVVLAIGLLGYGLPVAYWVWWARVRGGHVGATASLGVQVRWADLGWGPLTWVSCLLVQVVVGSLLLRSNVPFEGNAPDLSGESGPPVTYVVALLLLTVVAAPLIEEFVFRGMVLRALLSRYSASVAITIQGVLFGMAHADPSRGWGNIGLVVLLGSVGCVLGAAAYASRRLAASVIAHAMVNAIAMTVALVG